VQQHPPLLETRPPLQTSLTAGRQSLLFSLLQLRLLCDKGSGDRWAHDHSTLFAGDRWDE
jgi:hypothetical protein